MPPRRWSRMSCRWPRCVCAPTSQGTRPTSQPCACSPKLRSACAVTQTRRNCSSAASSWHRASTQRPPPAGPPTDVAALRMLAEVAARLRRYADAEELLERCLKLAPSFDAARHNYALVLNRAAKPAAALSQVEQLLGKEPRNPNYLNLKAAILANIGEYQGCIEIYEAVLKTQPRQPKIWMSYGHALKTDNRPAESIAAYRRAIGMEATLGEAYWSLANLKTFRFSEADTRAMHGALARTDLSDDDRVHFEFSLGKALE